MALGVFIAGRYTSTLSGLDLGLTRRGYEVQFQLKAEMIDETDGYGLTPIDFIQRGAECAIEMLCREWKAATIGAAWQALTGTFGVLSSVASPIGRLGSDSAQALVLSSTANTPAASAPATLTATKAILSPNFNVNSAWDSRLRELPLRFLLLPYTSGGSVLFCSTT